MNINYNICCRKIAVKKSVTLVKVMSRKPNLKQKASVILLEVFEVALLIGYLLSVSAGIWLKASAWLLFCCLLLIKANTDMQRKDMKISARKGSQSLDFAAADAESQREFAWHWLALLSKRANECVGICVQGLALPSKLWENLQCFLCLKFG